MFFCGTIVVLCLIAGTLLWIMQHDNAPQSNGKFVRTSNVDIAIGTAVIGFSLCFAFPNLLYSICCFEV